ncbi:hypothetical protein GGQ84_000253 [Desulfitispora alkaliphila]|uniref:hypothetical protein n=1 Tax=Desulfitispora alkaliphila TaxID=622674 RepID=UPI003D24D885
MEFLFAGLTAAFFSYVINRWIVNDVGDRAIGNLVPLVEETLKTGLALLVGASIFYTHLVFGVIEALYDSTTAINKGGSAAIVSLFSHIALGLIAQFAYNLTGVFLIAVIAAFVFHMAWNTWIVEIVSAKNKR